MGYKGCFIFRAAGNFLAIMYLRELNINLPLFVEEHYQKGHISVFLTPEVNKRKISDTSQPWIQDGKEELNIAIELDRR